jgi:hypothetical protein
VYPGVPRRAPASIDESWSNDMAAAVAVALVYFRLSRNDRQ